MTSRLAYRGKALPQKSDVPLGDSQVQGAVAPWSVISMRYFLRIFDSNR